MLLFILEFIGTQELLLIMIVALIVFGPRRLPELGRTLGKYMNEFRRTSEEFKRTWQQEVELEQAERETKQETPLLEEKHDAKTTDYMASGYYDPYTNTEVAPHDAYQNAYHDPYIAPETDATDANGNSDDELRAVPAASTVGREMKPRTNSTTAVTDEESHTNKEVVMSDK